MGLKAILDTNAVIYLQKGLLADDLPIGEYAISIISEMELLSFPALSDEQRTWLLRFIANIETVEIDKEIKQRAILLRRDHRLKLPDAIIAATAISRNAVLYSNDQGFANLPDLNWRGLAPRKNKE